MKITIDRTGENVHMELERDPMPPERFAALCKLTLAVIGGGVLLGAIALIGFLAIPWAVGALALVGVYKLLKKGLTKSPVKLWPSVNAKRTPPASNALKNSCGRMSASSAI